jgi:hypothetical protein
MPRWRSGLTYRSSVVEGREWPIYSETVYAAYVAVAIAVSSLPSAVPVNLDAAR